VRFLDTNVILRYLVQDDESKANACYELFQRVDEAREEITTCEAVISETVYVLSGRGTYDLPRTTVRELLRPILIMPGLKIARKRVYLLALDLFVTYPQLDYEDALIVAHMQDRGIEEVISYDEDFDGVPGTIRREPAV
jgi:predicted nucleic acid-binding protein